MLLLRGFDPYRIVGQLPVSMNPIEFKYIDSSDIEPSGPVQVHLYGWWN